jgi:hypothetical protein
MDYWKDRLNLFIALGPATNIEHVSAPLIYYIAEYGYKLVKNLPKSYIMDPEDLFLRMSNLICTVAPKHCNYD